MASYSDVSKSLHQFADKFVAWCVDNEWIGSSTHFLVSRDGRLEALAQDLGSKVGLDAATLKYVVLMLVAYPMAIVFAKLPTPTTKHLFSMLSGLWMMQFVFYSQWIHSLITAAVSYGLILVLPNKFMPYVVFFFVMCYMCAAHIYRMYVDYMGWSLDFTGPQMLLTIKLTSFAYNVYDGRKWDQIQDTGDKRKDRVRAQRRKYAIRKMPNPLEYFGFVYCFATILAGPAFEYKDYIDGVTLVAFRKQDGSVVVPPNGLVALRKMMVGLFFLAVHQLGTPYFPLTGMADDFSLAMPWYRRYAWAWLSLVCCRVKYYFAWMVADGGAVLAGFGFEGYDKEDKPKGWNGVSNIDILAFETAQNIAVNSRAWNKRTQGWLERYVYIRTNNSLTATYFMSAFWHGFYPGYYLFFMILPLATNAARAARKTIRPYFLQEDGETPGPLKPLYDVVTFVVNASTINYLVIPFQLLSWDRSIKVWRSYNFVPQICVLVVYIVCSSGLIPKRKTRAVAAGDQINNKSVIGVGSAHKANGNGAQHGTKKEL